MTRQTAISKPLEKCPLCQKKRIGVQEGIVIFNCGTYMHYNKESELKETRQSTECQKIVESRG